jgi:hypothetical protein
MYGVHSSDLDNIRFLSGPDRIVDQVEHGSAQLP